MREWSTIQKLIWIYTVIGAGATASTVSGTSPLSLVNALAEKITSLTQFGKCTQASTPTPSAPVDIKCNNGAIKVSANLLDPTTVPDENKYITSHSGGESTPGSGTFRHSSYIRIVGGEKYFFGMKPYSASTAGLAWYSAPNLGSYISGVNGTSLKNAGMVATAPASANYVRFSWMTSSGYDTDWQNSVYICVNGLMSAFRAFGEVYIDGTPEVLTVSASGAETQTASVENLFAVGDYKDEQDIISGAVTRRCAVCLYDGTQPVGDTYLSTTGGKDNGAIIVYPKGTNYSGAIASFDFDEEDNELGALSVAIEPIQDLHGYDNPWPAGYGKNKFDSSLFDTPTVSALVYTHYDVPNGTYTMSTPDFPLVNGIANVFFKEGVVTSGITSGNDGVTTSYSRTITVTDGHYTVVYRSSQSANTNNPKNFKWQIESGSTPTAWTPFSNICPISGHTDADVIVSPTLNPLDGTTYPIHLGTTVYGGTLDVVNGKLVINSELKTLTGNNNCNESPGVNGYAIYNVLATAQNRSPYISNLFKTLSESDPYTQTGIVFGLNNRHIYVSSANNISGVSDLASFKAYLNSNNLQVVIPLATPLTYQLTPQEVEMLLGENNLWSDAGEISVLVLEQTTESVTPQPLNTTEGTNTVTVTSNVDPVELNVEYMAKP